MFGDVLKLRIKELEKTTDSRKKDLNSFWYCLRDIAIEDLISYEKEVDSNFAIEIYYNILQSNEEYLPAFSKEILPSNGQERYRVCNRNLWSSNAWHKDGFENTLSIKSKKTVNCDRKGNKRTYCKGN